MVSQEAKLQRLQRELHRLRTSPSLRIGSHITDMMKKPWLAPFLIFTLPWQMLMTGLEMIGKRDTPVILDRVTQDPMVSQRNCVVMFPTNGVGFGHFTRMLALAKQMKKQDTDLEIIFFTTMPTLHLLKPYGIAAHHISGPKYFEDMTSMEWNGLVEEELNLCFEAHRPKQFIFDGAYPYRGMLRAIASKIKLDKVWVRRGTFRRGKSVPVDSISHFDLIVHPEDSVPQKSSEIEHNVPSSKCPPITLLDLEDLMTRSHARRRLKLPEDAIVVYVQIGAGQINDIDSEVRMTIDSITKNKNAHVVLGESMLGERFDFDLPRVHLLRDYPNSLYFNAFDCSVQAGGYNSYHEVKKFGLPTLFYPNMFTGMDNQLARCLVSVDEGWGLVLEKRNEKSIAAAVSQLLQMIDEKETTEVTNGAVSLAKQLLLR